MAHDGYLGCVKPAAGFDEIAQLRSFNEQRDQGNLFEKGVAVMYFQVIGPASRTAADPLTEHFSRKISLGRAEPLLGSFEINSPEIKKVKSRIAQDVNIRRQGRCRGIPSSIDRGLLFESDDPVDISPGI
jgi:hypothetical protein